MVFARQQGFFDQLLIVDIEHHATQAPRHSVFIDDEAASCPNPTDLPSGASTDPVLNIELAPGLDGASIANSVRSRSSGWSRERKRS